MQFKCCLIDNLSNIVKDFSYRIMDSASIIALWNIILLVEIWNMTET